MDTKTEFVTINGHIINRQIISTVTIKHTEITDIDNELIPDKISIKIHDKNNKLIYGNIIKFADDKEYDDFVNFIKEFYGINSLGDAYGKANRIVMSSNFIKNTDYE